MRDGDDMDHSKLFSFSPRISSAAEGYSEKFNKLIIGVWSPENGGIVIILLSSIV